MTTMQEVLAHDRRLAILRTLEEAPATQLNEAALHHGMSYLGHAVSNDMLRADIEWLREHGLVRVEEIAPWCGKLLLVRLTNAGADVGNGRAHHPGVARPDPA